MAVSVDQMCVTRHNNYECRSVIDAIKSQRVNHHLELVLKKISTRLAASDIK